MEEEARQILRTALLAKKGVRSNLAESIRKYVEPFGGVALKFQPREAIRRPPKFAK